ncbi:blast:Sortilin-related receptor [Drosophila guanche]|uniref:Blast:Sortilin-related receptor n=1 Tax=Drosophila guanche TaxID=7266 RepID=A0A3B0KFS4_DROGU|nr:blast:Sortilin-related receptor [Drosophila guanche]
MLDGFHSYSLLLLLICGSASAEVCKENDEWTCKEDGKCIPFGERCNGMPDCKHGSDESYSECKTHPRDMDHESFYCATGVSVNKDATCNKARDCPDGSDELPQICEEEIFGLKFKDLNMRGNCPNISEIECLPGECVSKAMKCDGSIDCSNGRDECLELCFQPCSAYPCFQCANGVLVDHDNICDNKIDCLDGSDEMLGVCTGNKESWIAKPMAICIEPPDGAHIFTKHTKFSSSNGTRFVYPNQPAELQCQSNNRTVWNVCTKDGSWNRELPPCRVNPVYLDADTNGTNGCRMVLYNKDIMRIHQVLADGQQVLVVPPILDVNVRFECADTYTFLPYSENGSTKHCQPDKQWLVDLQDFNPRCTKLCRPEELTQLFSLSPTCYDGEHGARVSCDDKYSLIPGTRVKFECAEGFMHLTRDVHYVRCTENGEWEGLQELCSRQQELCKYQCYNNNHVTTLSKSGELTNSLHASWVVPIYARKNDTQYRFACAGNLIGLNVVLTAGHCLYDLTTDDIRVGPTGNRSEIITEDYYEVIMVETYKAYFKINHNHDVGIIMLSRKIQLRQDLQVVCLPYNLTQPIYLNDSFSNVLSWSDDGSLMRTSGKIIEPRQHSGDVLIDLNADEKLCPGDSGAGLIMPCKTSSLCLVGVVSRSPGAGERESKCSREATAASIMSGFVQSWIEEIINHSPCLKNW